MPTHDTPAYGGHSQTAPLERALVCPPAAAGWLDPAAARGWRELGYRHPPDGALAAEQHGALRRALEDAGVEVLTLPPGGGLSLDALYPRDPTLVTDGGAVRLRMGKAARRGESTHHAAYFARLGIPELGRLEPPATAEAGDLVWLDRRTLLAGRSFRTNRAGIEQLRALLAPLGAEVVEAPIPHGEGAEVCLHLGSLLSPLEERVALVDRPRLAVETVEGLLGRGFELLDAAPEEHATHGANVLALGRRRAVAFSENRQTNERLRRAGFDVSTVPASEIGVNGGGGPTCLVCPLLRG
jgi:N-dimethylarginine dimethylaminohydrolase